MVRRSSLTLPKMSTQYGLFAKRVHLVCFGPKEKGKPMKRKFVRNGVTLRGILTPIHNTFANDYEFKLANFGKDNDREGKVDRRAVAWSAQRGLAKGRRLDTQLSRAFVFMSTFKLSITKFLELKKLNLKAKVQRSAQLKSAIHLSKTMMSNARALLVRWAERGLTIVATQLPVGCEAAKLGTAIDVVLMDKWLNYYIINVKTDNWKNYDKHTGTDLAEPYKGCNDIRGNRLKDSKRNQNQLQLLGETILWRKTYPECGDKVPVAGAQPEGCLFPEINIIDAEHIVREFPLQQWAIDKQTAFWKRLGG
jgi:hypothetical protein